MRRIFFVLIFLGLLKVDFAFAYPSSKLFLKQADEYYALGKKDAKAGNLDEAITYLQKAVAMNPYSAEAHYELAKLYEQKGEYERADREYQTAINLNRRLGLPAKVGRLVKDEEVVSEAEAWAKEIESEERTKKIITGREGATEEEIRGELRRAIPSEEMDREVEEGAVEAGYLGTTKKEPYPATRKGPTITTTLDPYHPRHEDFKIPYYKDRQGLKLTKNIGVGANYEYKKQFPMGVSILEAKQFAQTSDAQLREFVDPSETQFKEFQANLFYKEDWPKLRYTYHTEDDRRAYNAKKLWSNSEVWSENRDYHDILLKYTFAGLPHIGYLIVEPGYRRTKITSDNDPTYLGHENRYHLALTTALLDDLELFLEYNNENQKKENPALIYNSTLDRIKKDNYTIELRKNFPTAKFKIIPSYFHSKERWILSGDPREKWIENRFRINTEKKFNEKIEWNSESNWDFLERDRPATETPKNIRARYVGTEHWLLYQLFQDFKTGPHLAYYSGIDFKDLDWRGLGWVIRYDKPGLASILLDYGYTDFYRVDDHLDLVLLKFSFFM